MAVNYVKFQRGTQAAYDKLANAIPSRLDENTLYFIYPENDSTVGKLYLGSRLISGGDVVLASTSLADLSDVIVESVKANSFLVQNAEGKWDNLSLIDVATLIKNSANLISELVVEDDDVVILSVDGNKITGSHAKVGPANGASKGATADASISNFGESLQIKVPYVSVDKYGHTTVVDEKTLSISIPEAPSFIDTNTTYELRYENDEEGKKVIRLYDNSGAIVSTVDASDFIKDGMLDDVSYNAETNELTFVWNTSAGKTNDVVKLTDILDPYNAGNGINISGNEISIKLASGEKNLVVNENGLSTNFDLNNYATNAEAKASDGIRYINQTEINKLAALSLDGEDVTISGSVEAAQVKGLYAIVKNIVTATGSEDFDPEVEGIQTALGIELGAQVNKIESVDSNFVITEAKQLILADGKHLITTAQVEKLDSIAAGAEKNFISSVDETKFTVTEGKLLLKENYVTTTVYSAEVGDLTKLIRDEGRENTTLVDEINYINERLTWGEIAE